MTQSEAEEDGCDGESRASVTPILRLPERNEEDTRWTRADVTKPVSVKNKLTVEDMTLKVGNRAKS
jgi:hypothetical protein